MTVRILLARHGDTFHPGEKVVFVGSKNDLPLTPRGQEQAKEVGLLLARSKIIPTMIVSGPLKRTREFAEIIAQEMRGAPVPRIDSRLNEIDYGSWTGLSNEEVIFRFGLSEHQSWNERSIWPKNAAWPDEEQAIVRDVLDFAADVRRVENSLVLAVSSNGRLRYFPKSIPGAFEKMQSNKELKIKTGHVGLLEFTEYGSSISLWNRDPKAISSL